MAYFYIKFGGTATGDAGRSTTARTGSFAAMGASAYYNSIYDVFNDPATRTGMTIPDGDTFYVADDHSEGYTGNLTITSLTDYLLFKFITVDVTDCTIYKKATATTFAFSTNSPNFGASDSRNDNMEFIGFNIEAAQMNPNARGRFKVTDCTITLTGNIYSIQTTGVIIDRCTVTFDRLRSNTTITESVLISAASGTLYGYQHKIYNSDFSSCTGVSINTSAIIFAELYNCNIPSSWLTTLGTSIDHDVKNAYTVFYGCSDANQYYEYASFLWAGSVSYDTANYLSATYDGINSFSKLLSSNSYTDSFQQLRHKLVTIPAQDLTASKKIRVNLVTDNVQLTNADFHIEIIRPDNDELVLGVKQSSGIADPLSTATNLTEDTTNTWTSPSITTDLEQYIEETLPALSNVENGNIEVWISLSKSNTDVWVCPNVVITDA